MTDKSAMFVITQNVLFNSSIKFLMKVSFEYWTKTVQKQLSYADLTSLPEFLSICATVISPR